MVAHLSIATALDKNRISSATVYLLLMEVDVINPADGSVVETMYCTNNNEAFVFNGITYIMMPFEVDLSTDTDSTPTCTLTVYDLAQVFQAQLQAYGATIGWPARFKVINATAGNNVCELQQDFFINGASASGESYSIQFTVVAENPLTLRFPPRQQFRERCFWIYRDANCKYTGPLPTCDLTYSGGNGCKFHNNTLNYGGFPGLSQNSAYGRQ